MSTPQLQPPAHAGPSVQRLRDWGLLLLRVGGFGLLWAIHVRHKLATFEEEWRSFPDPLGIGHPASLVLALLAEGPCSLLVALGLFCRLASLPILFSMVVVLVLASGLPAADAPAALQFAIIYGGLALTGPGRLSLDYVLRRRYRALLGNWARVRMAVES
jgi:putative oxidoreductase